MPAFMKQKIYCLNCINVVGGDCLISGNVEVIDDYCAGKPKNILHGKKSKVSIAPSFTQLVAL